MKKKLNIIAFAIVVCVVSTLNVKIALNTNVLCDLAMTSINAMGSGEDSMDVGENDFPTDPSLIQAVLLRKKWLEIILNIRTLNCMKIVTQNIRLE